MQESNYLQALCAGDSKLIRGIYQQYAAQIQRWVLSNNGSSDDAQDLFQESLIAIYDRYCGAAPMNYAFGALLFTICKRKWYDQIKEKNRESVVRKIEEDRYQSDHVLLVDADAALSEQKKQAVLDKTFLQLSAQCQQLLDLLSKGSSNEEMAQQLGLANANAVYQSKHRCMSRWKELYTQLAEQE
jgi:RNA polymerase sigma factor (sigma-70 family)